MKKRISALFLCIVVSMMLLPVNAFAAEQITGTVTIDGTGIIGQELTATYSGGNVTNPKFKWLVSSTCVSERATFTPTEDMAGKTAYVQVMDGDEIKGGYCQESITIKSSISHILTFAMPEGIKVSYDSIEYVNGEQLTVPEGTFCYFSAINVPDGYVIEASASDRTEIKNTVFSSNVFLLQMPKNDITVTVTLKEDPAIKGDVTITGSGKVAEQLTATYSNGNITDPVFAWIVEADRKGEGTTFTPTSDMVGKTVYVHVTSASGQKTGYVQESISVTDNVDHTTHTFDKNVAASRYLKSVSDCTNAAVFYKSCACGKCGTETFVYGAPLGHIYSGDECTRCGIKKPAEPEPTPTPAPSHEHNWVWETITQPTEYSDGMEGYVCTICGATKDTVTIPSTGVFMEKRYDQVINAQAGDTVVLEMGLWHSLSKGFMEEIAQRRDVTFIIHSTYEHKNYEVVIPAGTPVVLDPKIDWYGILKQNQMFGMKEIL